MKRYILFICLLICCRIVSGQSIEYLIGEGDTISSYLPISSGSDTISIQLYTAEELGFSAGNITKIAFYNTGPDIIVDELMVFMANTDKEFFPEDYDFLEDIEQLIQSHNVRFYGSHTFTNGWSEIVFNNGNGIDSGFFMYEGGNIIMLMGVNSNSSQLPSTSFKANTTQENRAVYLYMDENDNQAIAPLKQNNQIKFTVKHIEVSPEEVALGEIRMGDYWSEKEQISVPVTVNSGVDITNISCDNDLFILSEIDYESNPITFNVGYDKNAVADGEQTANITITSAGYEPVVIPVTATAYTPVQGDVFENPIAIDFSDNASFSDTPDFAAFRDDYILPNENEALDGKIPDVVYSFTLEEESVITANVTGVSSNFAIYTAEDLENSGPSSDNSFISSEYLDFFYDFEDGSLEDFNLIEYDYNNDNWELLDYIDNNYIYSSSYDGASNYLVTKDTYNITNSSELSFDIRMYEPYDNNIYVYISPYSSNITAYHIETIRAGTNWGNRTINLGEKIAELGLEYGNYYITFGHRGNNGSVSIDNLKLTKYMTDLDEIPLPAGSYYLIASAEDSLSLDVNLKYDPTVDVNVVAIDGASVEGTTVSLVNVNDSDLIYETTLDESGYYQWINVAKGTYELTIDLNGYRSCATTEMLEINADTTINCGLTVITELEFELPEMGSDISYHFWFDEDYDNVQTGSLGDGVFMLDVSELSDGIHTLNVMLEGNMLSSPQSYMFMKMTEIGGGLPEMGSDISYHFWFDEDYDNVQTGSLGDGVFMLDVSELSDGIHTLNVMLEGNMYSSPLTFTFAKSPSYNLNAYCQGGLGEVTGTGVYPDSSYVEIEAVPYEGYHFVCWNDSLVDNPRTIQLTQDTTFIANLMINQYNVELFVQDSTMGSVTGSGIYNYNENIRVQAFSNENHTFLYWMEADSIVSTESEYNFTVKNDRQLTAVFCFGVFHNTMLSEGWNWYSTFVDVEGNAGYEMLTDGLGSNAIIVKSQTHFTTYYEDYDIWDGSLDAVDNEHLYMIKMSDEQNLPMIGAVSDPSNINLTLNPGWTWISYPIKESQALNESLSGFTPRHGDYFKSQTEYARYYEGYGWDGSLLLLESGKGYMYKNSDTIAKTLTYQESDGKDIIVKNITTNDNHWHADINKYADNMNITAVVSFNDVELTADNFEIGAFVDGECRGSAKAVYREMVDRYVFYLTVYGVEDENVSFRLFDSYLDAEYPETEENIVFNVNATIGDIINPYIINYSIDNINELDFEEVVNIYPNPALVNEVVCLNRKYEKVELINSLGIVVNTYINANKIDGIKVPGIYILRISDGKIITNNKLIVR